MTSKLAEKLHDPEYRKAFVASEINFGIPFQVRALLKERGWTQGMLAQKADMLQPRISGLMTPGKTRPNIDTLRRLAEAFDCGLAVRFVPFSELAAWSEQFDPESFSVPDFEHDPGFIERKEAKRATATTLAGLVARSFNAYSEPAVRSFIADTKTEFEIAEVPASQNVKVVYISAKPFTSTQMGIRYTTENASGPNWNEAVTR